MTTITIDVPDSGDARKIAAAVRQFRGVAKVKVHEDADFEPVPGLPYTKEERIASICRAEEDYAAGRFVTTDELRAKHPRL